VARLRALQEKVADRQSEEDENRARRWQEAKDREWRGRERAAAERQVGACGAAGRLRLAVCSSSYIAVPRTCVVWPDFLF
jgi:hypothetical protein